MQPGASGQCSCDLQAIRHRIAALQVRQAGYGIGQARRIQLSDLHRMAGESRQA